MGLSLHSFSPKNIVSHVGQIAGVVGGGMVANTIVGGIQGATTLAGVLGLGGGPLPQQGSQGGGYGQSQDQGYQQNLAGLMQMTGQQAPVMTSPTSIGGGGLI